MCGNPPCTGISIEHLIVDGGAALSSPQTNNGIFNNGAGDQSYVNDVTINNVSYTALVVSNNASSSGATPYATGSGPYTNVHVNIGRGTCGSNCAPACVVMMAQTRGLHGLTCIGTNATTGITAAAGVYVVASNNSVEDAHFESFWDGVQVFAGAGAAVSNVDITNITGAVGLTNVVHICGNSGPTCTSSTYAISDVSILGVSLDNSSAGGSMAILDDQTGAYFGNIDLSVGLYVIGDLIGNATGNQYSRFTTMPNGLNSSGRQTGSYSPVWGVGVPPSGFAAGSLCLNYGALFSATNGTSSGNVLYVCEGSSVSGTWKKIF
jgi:hypothetical protein